MVRGGAEAEAARQAAEQAIRQVNAYGPEMRLQATIEAASLLAGGEGLSFEAETFARRAEKLLEPTTPPNVQMMALKALAQALKKTAKTREAKAVQERIARLDEVLDREFLANAVPFKPAAFAGRKGKGERRVL